MADEKEVAERVNPFEAEVKAENEKRSGKGLRWFTGFTRGQGSLPIKFEAFDDSQPETNPETIAEFMQLTGVQDQKDILSFVLEGYNAVQRRNASDPIAEYINPVWSDADKLAFRLSVRNMSKAFGQPIETVAVMVKNGVDAKYAAK